MALLVTLVLPSTYRASGAVILARQGRPPGADPALVRAVVAAKELLRSRAVADSAVANLKLDESPEELLDDIGVTAEPETSLVRLSVDAGSGEQARRIAQELAEVFTVLFNGRFGPGTTAAVWEAPQAEEGRVSPRPARNLGLGGALGLLVGAGILVARRRPPALPPPAVVPLAITTPAPVVVPTAPMESEPELLEPEPIDPEPAVAAIDERLQARLAAVTARELALARRAAGLALRERELDVAPSTLELDVAETHPAKVAVLASTNEVGGAPEAANEPELAPMEPFVPPKWGEWTIGDVTRLLDEQGPRFPDTVEGLGFYLGACREVADPGGRLPAGVGIVLEDVFAELIEDARRRS